MTGAGRRTQLEYDDHGRLTKRIDPDPDGIGPVEAPETEYSYDPVGRRTKTTEPDPDGDGDETPAVTEYSYDGLGRKTETKGPDPDGDEGPKTNPITTYTYDVAGRRTGLTDPEENTTQWTYGAHGHMITETITLKRQPAVARLRVQRGRAAEPANRPQRTGHRHQPRRFVAADG